MVDPGHVAAAEAVATGVGVGAAGVGVAPAGVGVAPAGVGVGVAPAAVGVAVAPAEVGIAVAPAGVGVGVVSLLGAGVGAWVETRIPLVEQPATPKRSVLRIPEPNRFTLLNETLAKSAARLVSRKDT
jgi:hypothetical protein